MRKLLAVTLLLASLSLTAQAGDTPIAGSPELPPCQVDCPPPPSSGQAGEPSEDATEPTEDVTVAAALADALVAFIANAI